MATPLYLTSGAATVPTFTSAVGKLMSIARGNGVLSQVDATVVSLVTAANPQSTGAISPISKAASTTLAAAGTVESSATIGASWIWVSNPLNSVTVSGTITANLRALESAAAANYAIGCKLYKITGGAISAAFAQGSNTTELGTAEAAMSISLTPTSTAFANGDQIAVMVFYCSPSGSTSTSGRTATLFYNGTTSAASGDTFLSFTETITEQAPAFVRNRPVVKSQAVMRAAQRCVGLGYKRRKSGIFVPGEILIPKVAFVG